MSSASPPSTLGNFEGEQLPEVLPEGEPENDADAQLFEPPRASSCSWNDLESSSLPRIDSRASLPEATSSSRPHLKVHWRSKTGEPFRIDTRPRSFVTPDNPSEEDLPSARRSVTGIFRRPLSQDIELGLGTPNFTTSAAASLDSRTSSPAPSRRRKTHHARRPSSISGASASSFVSDEGSEDDDVEVGRTGGVLSAMIGLYGSDSSSRKKRKMIRPLLARRDTENLIYGRGGSRRRWSTDSLFATNSRSSSRSGLTTPGTGVGADELDGPEVSRRLREEAIKVHRNRRRQKLPHRSEDLNEPYIPSPRYSNPLEPSANVTMVQRFRAFMTGRSAASTLLGAPGAPEGVNPARQKEGTFRTMVALLVTTSSLVGVASPTLAHVAPASGQTAESSGGKRKISWYEGMAEKEAARQAKELKENSEWGLKGDSDFAGGTADGRPKEKTKPRRTRGKRVQREIAVTRHISNIIQRKKFIELLAKGVVNYGAPAHSVEAWLASTADILAVEASFIYLPSVLFVAFRDTDVHSTDVLFIRPTGGLELYRLSLVHEVYRRVTHDKISASQGCRALRRIEDRTVPYSRLTLILIASVASATSARVAFSGSFIDILMSGVLGCIFTIVQFAVSKDNRVFSNIFEIGMAGILSFAARGLGSTGYFCYDSLASASIVLILPGWHICLGALELGSKNIIAGAIRLVWAVVYTLFLSLGLGVGSEIWDAFGPAQPSATTTSSAASTSTTISGTFTSDTIWDDTFGNGTFTFTNGSSTSSDVTTVDCYRNPDWHYWWYTQPNDWWLILLVPVFAFSLAVWFRADWRSKDIIVMVLVACAGYVVNFYLSDRIDQTNVTSAVSAFTIGVLGNLYSRLGRGSAFPSMVVGILLIVPNAIAAAGGLQASSSGDDDSSSSSTTSTSEINTAVIVSIRMVQVGIGLAIGLFAATVAVYPLGKQRRYLFSY